MMVELSEIERLKAVDMIKPVFEEAYRKAFGRVRNVPINGMEVVAGRDWIFKSSFPIGDLPKQYANYGIGKNLRDLAGSFGSKPHTEQNLLYVPSRFFSDDKNDSITAEVNGRYDAFGEFTLRFNPDKVQLKNAIPLLAGVMKDYKTMVTAYLAQPFKVHMDVLLNTIHAKLDAQVSYDHAKGENGKIKMMLMFPTISVVDSVNKLVAAIPNEIGRGVKIKLKRELMEGVIDNAKHIRVWNLLSTGQYGFSLSQETAEVLAHIDLKALKQAVSQERQNFKQPGTQASRG